MLHAILILVAAIVLLGLARWGYLAQKKHWISEGWSVGHKLGRVSGMLGKDVMDKWLTDAGIDPTMLPPVR